MGLGTRRWRDRAALNWHAADNGALVIVPAPRYRPILLQLAKGYTLSRLLPTTGRHQRELGAFFGRDLMTRTARCGIARILRA